MSPWFSGMVAGGLVEAYKIILAASSLLLGRNWHLHQLIYTRGIGSNILGAFEQWFLDFAYYFLQTEGLLATCLGCAFLNLCCVFDMFCSPMEVA